MNKDNPIIVQQFFENLKDNTTLLFTTFPLDEIVLAHLLKKYLADDFERKVIVLCDIMAWRHRGYLKSFGYKNITILPVQLIDTPKKFHRCPIFHSKIWAEIDTKKNIYRQLLVSSFNLSQFHFDKAQSTLDAGYLWNNLKLPLPRFFNKILQHKSTKRIRLKPVTIEIAGSTGKFITEKSVPVGKIIKNKLSKKISRLHCAAPFLNIAEIINLGIDKKKLKTYQAKAKYKLHAKFVYDGKTLFWGSPNLTGQALWGWKNKPVNHETIVISLGKPQWKMFKSVKMDNNEQDEIDDEIFRDIRSDDWTEEKKLAENAPDELKLTLNKNNKAVLEWDKLCGAKYIKIYEMEIKTPKTIRSHIFKPEESVKLAKQIRKNGKLEAVGYTKSGRLSIWKKEIELPPAIWHISSQIRMNETDGKTNKNKERQKKNLTCHNNLHQFEDVRSIRDKELEFIKHSYGDLGKYYHWYKWFADNACIDKVPKWCSDLAKSIGKRHVI